MLLHRACATIVWRGAVIPPAKKECSKLKLDVLKNNKLFLIAMTVCLLLNSQIIPEAPLKEDMKEIIKAIQTHNIKITPSLKDRASTPSYNNTYL